MRQQYLWNMSLMEVYATIDIYMCRQLLCTKIGVTWNFMGIISVTINVVSVNKHKVICGSNIMLPTLVSIFFYPSNIVSSSLNHQLIQELKVVGEIWRIDKQVEIDI